MIGKKIGSASDRAYKAIKNMIFNYHLVPGQNIEYFRLAEKLGMSKTPIINSLHRLEEEGYVVCFQNRGFFVKEIDIKELKELFRIREAMEMLVVEEGIKNQNPKLMKEIEEAMISHRNYPYDIITRERQLLDMAFHLKIAEMSKNENLYKLNQNVMERIKFRYKSEIIDPQRAIATKSEHQKIFDAIKERKASLAKRLVKNHVREGQISTIRGMKSALKGFEFIK